MYTTVNFKTKKALKDALTAGQQITFFQPGPSGGSAPRDGSFCLEGPHYPMPHKWYAEAQAKDGLIISVK